MPTQKLWIRGLKHEDEIPIARQIEALAGVFYAVLNHADECAEVDFEDDDVTLDQIRSVIRSAGYEAEGAG